MSKREEQYHSASHCRYLTQYHVIWCPKHRYPVLDNSIDDTLKQALQETCDRYKYTIKALEVMPDHVHILVDCPQTVAPSDIARTLKSTSATKLLSAYPELRRRYARAGTLWSAGYFVSTIGPVSETAIRKYIEEQKEHERQ